MVGNAVLIISDNVNVYQPIQTLLQNKELKVYVVSAEPDKFEDYIRHPHALAIVDASLGEDNLQDILKEIRQEDKAPILVLYDGSEPVDRLTLFQAGATVFMEQTAAPQEQSAQAQALIDIYCGDTRERLIFGDNLIIVPASRLVILNGERLKLTHREYQLLRYLADHDQTVVSREEIYKAVWGGEYYSEDAVKSCVRVLREKLRPAGRELIETVRGIGYRFSGND